MAFTFPKTRKAFNQLLGKSFAPLQHQALRAAFGPEIAVKDTALAVTSTTLAADPDLVVDVIAYQPYLIKFTLYMSGTGGTKVDLAGGTAIASSYNGKTVFTLAAGATPVTVDVTALNTAQSSGAAALYIRVEHEAVAVFSTGGTLVLQRAGFTSTSSTANIGSYLSVEPLTSLYSR